MSICFFTQPAGCLSRACSGAALSTREQSAQPLTNFGSHAERLTALAPLTDFHSLAVLASLPTNILKCREGKHTVEALSGLFLTPRKLPGGFLSRPQSIHTERMLCSNIGVCLQVGPIRTGWECQRRHIPQQ